MGCWDVTCAISHLPIQEDDPIRFIFLRQPLYYDGIQKSWATWLPVTVPLKGVYNSYGAIEKYERHEDDRIVQFQVDCLKRFAVWESSPDDDYDKEPDDPEFPNTMESLINACERGGLRLRLPYRDYADEDDPKPAIYKTVHTAPFMIHEEIYQHMVAGPDRDPPGVGTWRHRLEQDGDRRFGRGKIKSLRAAVEWANGADDRAKLREILAKEGKEDRASILDEVHSMFLRDSGSNLENMPDMTCIGNEWEPKIESWPSLFKFTEEDWSELGNRVFEQEVLFWTMRECRRLMHPALHMDQYWYPENNLDGNRMLNHYVDKMTVALQEKGQREQEENP
jgi:hypothetical protein